MARGRKQNNSNSAAHSPAPPTSTSAPAPQAPAPLVAGIHDGIVYDGTSFSSQPLQNGTSQAKMKSSLNHEGNVVHGVAYDLLVEYVKQTLATPHRRDVALQSVLLECNKVYASEKKPQASESNASKFLTKFKKLGEAAQELTNAQKGFPDWTKLFTEGTKEQRKEIWNHLVVARKVDEAGFLDESAHRSST